MITMVKEYEVKTALYYSKDHLWTRSLPEGLVKIGLTDYGQRMLRTIMRIEVKPVGAIVQQFEPFGTVESIKATIDLVAPLSGEIEKVNDDVVQQPHLMNIDPYGTGWIMVLKSSNLEEELKELLDAEGYRVMISEKS